MPASPCKRCVMALCLDLAFDLLQPPVDQGRDKVFALMMGCMCAQIS